MNRKQLDLIQLDDLDNNLSKFMKDYAKEPSDETDQVIADLIQKRKKLEVKIINGTSEIDSLRKLSELIQIIYSSPNLKVLNGMKGD
jgi:hypothetical protein